MSTTTWHTLVVADGALVGEGLPYLLREGGESDIVAVGAVDDTTLLAIVRAGRPEVVVVGDRRTRANPALVLALLESALRVRVVVVHEHENQITVYERHQITVTTARDGMAAIRSDLKARRPTCASAHRHHVARSCKGRAQR